MARPALAALTLAAVLAAAAAPDPCCLRVTPYHIQALAQRMAQRFQALEYRAQDLRYVFASFQAVHGNVSHRLRYLEAEHAHLSELVSRLDSRVQSLEEEKTAAHYRQQMAYYRRPRDYAVRTPIDDLMKSQRRPPPFVMRRRRNENRTELPHLFVHLDQSRESSEEIGNISFVDDASPSADSAERPSTTETSLGQFTSTESVTVHGNLKVNTESENVSGDSEQRPKPQLPLVQGTASEAPPQLMHDAPSSDSATTPTPLWQLEETASALLDVMSAGEDNVGDANVPAGAADDAISYWSPANETDSLEELFNPSNHGPSQGTLKCTGQSTVNCSGETQGERPKEGGPNVETSTDATVSQTVSVSFVNNSSDTALPQQDAASVSSNTTLASGTGSENNASAEKETAQVPVVKSTACKTSNRVAPVGEFPVPSDNATNLTRLLLDMGNDTSSLLDIFSPSAGEFGADASPPPDGSGGGGGGGEDGASPTCGPDGCGAELSDAELQTALHELDALLQRPPASAQPPDPEKVLLKRALTLALAALERTSDACLKLVNFTADAFEGMAATEA